MAIGTTYIHIGAHKTGSSALQAFIRNNQAALAEAGVYSPPVGKDEDSGHHANLIWERIRPERYEPAMGGLNALSSHIEGQSHENLLISSEEFEMIPTREGVTEFLDAFRVFSDRIRIVLYLRPQFQYASSAWFEALKGGNISYFRFFYRHAINWRRLDFNAYFKKWEKQPKTELMVRPMTSAVRAGGIAADLLSVMGLSGLEERFSIGVRKNLGLSPSEVYALLYAGFRFQYNGLTMTHKVSRRIRNFCATLEQDGGTYRALTRAEVDAAENKHRRGNRAFFKRHGVGEWEDVFKEDLDNAGAEQNTDVPLEMRQEIERFIDANYRAAG